MIVFESDAIVKVQNTGIVIATCKINNTATSAIGEGERVGIIFPAKIQNSASATDLNGFGTKMDRMIFTQNGGVCIDHKTRTQEGDIVHKFDQVVAGARSVLIDGIDRIRKGDGAICFRSCISNLKNLRILGVGGIIFRIDLLRTYGVRD